MALLKLAIQECTFGHKHIKSKKLGWDNTISIHWVCGKMVDISSRFCLVYNYLNASLMARSLGWFMDIKLEVTPWQQQNPWQNNDVLILGMWSSLQNQPLASSFTRIIYDKCLKNLSKGISLGPNRIPNDILKALPKASTTSSTFHFYNTISK